MTKRHTQTLVGHKMEILLVLEPSGKDMWRTLFRRIWRDSAGKITSNEANAVAIHKDRAIGEEAFSKLRSGFLAAGFSGRGGMRGRALIGVHSSVDAFLLANKISLSGWADKMKEKK